VSSSQLVDLGWALLGAGTIVCVLLPVLTRGRFAAFGGFARWLTRTRARLVVVFLAWLWLGWHLFVR
jgi:hypothetical protein